MENMQNVRKKANTYFFSKVIVNALLMIIGAVLITLFLRQVQRQTALFKQRENSEKALTEAVSLLAENESDVAELTKVFHDGNQDMLRDLNELLRSGFFESLATADMQTRSNVFLDMVNRSGVDYLFVMSKDGTSLLAPYPEYTGINLVEQGVLSPENLEKLVRGTEDEAAASVEPVLENNSFGYFFFYSVPCTYRDSEYWLILVADASSLDRQIDALKNMSSVLSRSATGNNGFLFAVDTGNNSFLYFENGSEVLTGQDALAAGLSEKALQDGYAGTETINGTRYYCVSRTFGSSTVICAVAETVEIFAYNRYALFGSILGFVLVMLLCLGYAIIIRNDFVRKEVETDKRTFKLKNGNTLIFDRSIFRKVFPLTIAGAMLIFGITFYTQTLLEISESIEHSSLAIEEISARYNEGIEARKIIQSYYDNRFSAMARLIAYIIEEDPAVLNTPSDRYHSVYDENGNRQFLIDDEGNRLKSVSASQRLQELCDNNDLEAVYLYDEDGHVIATNKTDWYFVLSHNPEAQSYPFLEVIDGKRDVYVQEPMMSDNNVFSQYIGVAMTYYTTRDEDGNTLYVSNYDYERAREEDGEAARRITRHRGMLQLSAKQELADKILAATELDSIFSTDLLNGGSMALYDNSTDHLCLYSPIKARIGMKAGDIGLSEKAFSGRDYYGFFRMDGASYFQFVRYQDGYYIETVTPRSGMFQSRATISLFTVITSLILILILCGTVTFTTEEEEKLYAVMTDPETAGGLDSKIFNVVLPSGRRITTVKAASRWDNKSILWSERSPEQKLMLLIFILCSILVLYIIITAVGSEKLFDEGSIIRYILSGNWERGLNIFALSACVLVMIFTAVAVSLIRIPIRIITSILGARSETIGHLLLSVVKYGSAIGVIFYCLYLVGMDPTSLLASAGLLSLVIGLGAQSLIKDILAGIFIVFEGEFRVGDIVTIGGYRGTVMDIGLRTTKIIGGDGNIKIYCNSDISGVLNMTKEASVAACTISIEYGQDIDYVESVLRHELPLLQEENDQILEGPTYIGISNLGESGIDLMIICKCSEHNIKGVIRYLNKALLQIFYRYSINIPFPNVTVSQLDMSDRKTMEDLEQMLAQNSPKGK